MTPPNCEPAIFRKFLCQTVKHPGIPTYTLTTPTFDKVTIHLDKNYYPDNTLVIEVENPESESPFIEEITSEGKKMPYRISHDQLLKGLRFNKK